MKSKSEMIEDAIDRNVRRMERIEELYLSGEIDMFTFDKSMEEALLGMAELEQELDEQLRREDEAINWMSPREDNDRGTR